MYADEKRELRLQISQLLADAGLNQGKIKEIVEQEIKNKVDRAIEQTLSKLNGNCYSGNYLQEEINKMVERSKYNHGFDRAVENALKSKVIQVVLKDIECVDERTNKADRRED